MIPEAQPKFATEMLEAWDYSLAEECIGWAHEVLAVDLMPWQRDTIQRTLALNSDGELVHDVASIVTVPRQQGKSWVIRVIMLWWSVKYPGSWSVFVAQTRKMAVLHVEEMNKLLNGTDVDHRYYRGVPEHLEFGNGSQIHVAAPDHVNVHGITISGVAAIDEAWVSLTEPLLQGIVPARIAADQSLLLILSTHGAEGDTPWNDFVARGRESEEGIAFTEYGMDQERHDLWSPKDQAEWMPALGITVTARKIMAGLKGLKSAGEQRRAYGNIPTSTIHDVFDMDQWRSLEDVFQEPRRGDLVLGISASDSKPRGSSVVACWRRSDDERWHVELVEHRPGGGVLWIVEEVENLIREYKPLALTIGGTSAVYAVAAEIKAAAKDYAIPYKRLPAGEDSAACAMWSEVVRDGTITHGQSEAFDLSMEYAVQKQQGDAGWRIDGARMKVDASPLSAGIAALAMAVEEFDHGLKPGIF